MLLQEKKKKKKKFVLKKLAASIFGKEVDRQVAKMYVQKRVPSDTACQCDS